MHWPVPYDTNDLNPPPVLTPPLHETWEAMEQLVDEGLVKTIGVSNFSIPKLHDIMVTHKARIKPAVNQIEVHPYLRNDKVIEHCRIHVSLAGVLLPYLAARTCACTKLGTLY